MGKTILVVDDCPKNLKMACDLLKLKGYNVLQACNGKQSIEQAENMPDLIIMDIQMPEMNGIEATTLLKNNPKTKNIPIVAFTAYIREQDKKHIVDAGFNHYMEKPLRIKPFMEMVEKYCGEISAL